jgi:DNA-binding SARP family transcriptional activator
MHRRHVKEHNRRGHLALLPVGWRADPDALTGEITIRQPSSEAGQRIQMPHLLIRLFGGFQVELDGKPLAGFGTDKNRTLLAYLALEFKHPHRRETLAALFWPDASEAHAHCSLRQELYQLRHVIDPITGTEPHLIVHTDQVWFNTASDHWIDVVEFDQRLSAFKSHHPTGLSICSGCLKSLQLVTDLYRGDLLAGFTLPRCTKFCDWQIISQEIFHRQMLDVLTLLADHFETNLLFDQLIAITQKKIELEPWRESAYRRQMWAQAMSGQREQALLCYEPLCQVLLRELRAFPTDETRYLYQQIRIGALSSWRSPLEQDVLGDLQV